MAMCLVGSTILSEEIHYEAPCVDGDGDVNLEGIMCDKVKYFTPPAVKVILPILTIMGLILGIWGSVKFVKSELGVGP